MDLKDLQYFLAIAQEQSFTAAADKVHVTQSTLSKRILALEEELGKELFTRGGQKKVAMTAEGELLFHRAQEIVALADRVRRDLSSSDTELSGDICIGAGETRGVHFIARAIKKMHEIHPRVRFHIYSGDEEFISEHLDSGLIDFGLFVGLSNLRKYDYLLLPQKDRFGLLMRADDPLASHETVDPNILPTLPLICSRQVLNQNELAWLIGQGLEQLNVVGTYSLLFNASILVEEGLGYAVCIGGLIDHDKLCFRPLTQDKSVNLSFAWRKQRVFAPAAQSFLTLISQILNQSPSPKQEQERK